MILLWMNGGPSHIDTWDPKQGKVAGPNKAIKTSVPGVMISEHMAQIARLANKLAIVRGMTSKEGNHQRAQYLLRTGYVPNLTVAHPSLAAWVTKRLGEPLVPAKVRSRWYPSTMRPLTTDMKEDAKRPYFLWDEDVTIGELRERLKSGSEYERTRLLGKMLREARDIDVWHFVTPAEVATSLPALGRRLGRRRAFWEFLIHGWQADGLLPG